MTDSHKDFQAIFGVKDYDEDKLFSMTSNEDIFPHKKSSSKDSSSPAKKSAKDSQPKEDPSGKADKKTEAPYDLSKQEKPAKESQPLTKNQKKRAAAAKRKEEKELDKAFKKCIEEAQQRWLDENYDKSSWGDTI